PNLALRAAEIGGRRERESLVDAALAEALAGPGGARGTAIVYAPTRKQADEESARLTARRWRARSYHAGPDGKGRDVVQRDFGDEAETLAGCGRCDVCLALGEDPEAGDPERVTLIVRKALSGVARVHGRFGLQLAVKLIRGEPDERLERAGLTAVKTFGNLKEHAAPWL